MKTNVFEDAVRNRSFFVTNKGKVLQFVGERKFEGNFKLTDEDGFNFYYLDSGVQDTSVPQNLCGNIAAQLDTMASEDTPINTAGDLWAALKEEFDIWDKARAEADALFCMEGAV